MTPNSSDDLPVAEVGAWAKRKHEIIGHYIDITSAVRRKFSGDTAFVDLYCGPGRAHIKDSTELIDGSAVAAWRASQTSRVKDTAFGRIYIADKEPAYVDACTKRLAGAPVEQFIGDASDCTDQILKRLNPNAYTVVLIDPYNLGGLRYDIIERFARLKSVDFIAHISTMDIERNIGRYFDDADSPLDAFAPGWREKISLLMTSEDKLRAVFEHWKTAIGQHGFKVDADPQTILSSKNRWIYWLALASRNKLAADFWGKIAKLAPQRDLFS